MSTNPEKQIPFILTTWVEFDSNLSLIWLKEKELWQKDVVDNSLKTTICVSNWKGFRKAYSKILLE